VRRFRSHAPVAADKSLKNRGEIILALFNDQRSDPHSETNPSPHDICARRGKTPPCVELESESMSEQARYRPALGANRRVKTTPKHARVNTTVLPLRVRRAPSLSATIREPLDSATESDQLGLAAIRNLC
jgi:hypothetical protein